jgi:hypothetical protein
MQKNLSFLARVSLAHKMAIKLGCNASLQPVLRGAKFHVMMSPIALHLWLPGGAFIVTHFMVL